MRCATRAGPPHDVEELETDRERLSAVESSSTAAGPCCASAARLRDAARDPDDAAVRDADIVERYRQ
jgi:hypothetical protein